MAEITPQLVKELRDRTGIGVGKCKEALQEANGDIELAISNLRKAGMAQAVKKEGREANEGLIQVLDENSKIVLVQINAETDFVVKNSLFQEFAQNIAQEIFKTSPIAVADLMAQQYSKDKNLTVDEYRASVIQSLGENIQVRRFETFLKKPNTSIAVYSHGGGKLVTLVEIEGGDKEESLAKDIAMHVAAEAPEYLSSEEIPERVLSHEKEIARAQMHNKPENIIEKIIEGKLKAYFQQACLLHQSFIKDPSVTIAQLLTSKGKELGKSLKLTQFIRWKVGE